LHTSSDGALGTNPSQPNAPSKRIAVSPLAGIGDMTSPPAPNHAQTFGRLITIQGSVPAPLITPRPTVRRLETVSAFPLNQNQ